MSVELPENELIRLEALKKFQILDTEEDETYNAIAELASNIMETPLAMITLIDKDRAWIKAQVGNFPINEAPREHSFCAQTILNEQSMLVENAALDRRFRDNPYVMGESGIRFYFGVPLITSDNQAIGTICAVDSKPRKEPTASQINSFKNLSKIIISKLELRKIILDLNEEISKIKITDLERAEVYKSINEKADLILKRIKARKDPT